MKKKRRRKIPPNLHPEHLAGRLCDLDDAFDPIIGFIRVIGRASQTFNPSAPDDSVVWVTLDIEAKLDEVRTEIDLVRSALRKLEAQL